MHKNEWKDTILDIQNFSLQNKNIYIYGAGVLGSYYKEILDCLQINVCGFIVSKREENYYYGTEVFEADEMLALMDDETAIICAIKANGEQIIKEHLGQTIPLFVRDFELIKQVHFFSRLGKIKKGIKNEIKDEIKDATEDILLIRLDAIGDLVCTTPVIRELKKFYPDARIHLVINKNNKAIVENNPYIYKVYLFDCNWFQDKIINSINSDEYRLAYISNFIKENIGNVEFDCSYHCVPMFGGKNTLDSLIINICCKVKNRFAYILKGRVESAIAQELFRDMFSDIYCFNQQMHETDYMFTMLQKSGVRVQNREYDLYPKKNAYIEKLLSEKEVIYVAIGVVGSTPERNWSRDYFRAVFAELETYSNKKINYCILGGRDAVEAGEYIKHGMHHVINLTGNLCLEETIACINKCHMYVGADTGLLHISVALKKPCVPIYAVNQKENQYFDYPPIRFGVRGVRHIDMIPKQGLEDCKPRCKKRYGHCINQIKPEQVCNAIKEILADVDFNN